MTKEIISKDEMHDIHPRIPAAYDAFKGGRISRREFMRFATLLGMSAAVATACAGGGGEEAAAPAATGGEGAAASSRYGGDLKIGALLQLVDQPARLSWAEGANVVRQVAEYLTLTQPDNITVPYLLESWTANEDVTEWTLNLRQGILFNNGEELTADDVVFNFSQWLDPEIGSSMLGLLNYLDGMNSVEKVDDYTVKLNLTTGNIGVPEHLYHYPAAIMHRSFEGDFIKQPIGTGPFTLEEWVDGERAVVRRREGYWQSDAEGNELPYLDSVTFVSIDKEASVAAMQSGQLNTFYNPGPANWQALKDDPNMVVQTAQTAQTVILRARVDLEPWDDVRVRNALKAIQNREEILQLAWFGEGDLGVDAHIAPVHPAYPDGRAVPEQDVAGALALLEEYAAEKGIELPIKATIVTKNDEGEAEYAQALAEMAEGSGFDFDLEISDPAGYWEVWDQVPLGITAWTHRSLDTMVLPLAYIADGEGTPVPWNETRWVDEEFSSILTQAEGTLDVEARKELMGQLIDIFQERGPIGVAFFKSAWRIHTADVKNLPGHPTAFDLLTETYFEA